MTRWLWRAWYSCFDRELMRPLRINGVSRDEAGTWNAEIGAVGERVAAKFLRRKGRRILYRNFRPKRGGEIDIVCRDRETLVFVEVKTRSSERFGRPGAAVDRQKQDLLVRGANAWMRELDFPELLFRFDVVEVILEEGAAPEIRLIESAFQSGRVGVGL